MRLMPKTGIGALEKPGAFGMYVRRLHDVMATQLEASLIEAGIRLKGATTTIVWLLHYEGAMSLTDVANRLHYSHQLATQRVEWLEQRRFVKIVSDPNDRRRKKITLTAAGVRECKKFEKHVAALENAYSGIFNEIGVDAMKVVRDMEEALLSRTLSARIGKSAARAA